MYPVSSAYRQAIKKRAQRHDLRGTIGTESFTRANVLSGSFRITNQCSDGTSLQIGQVYVGELTATFRGVNIDRYSWRGLEIVPEFGIRLADNSTEWVPLGVYIISEADQTESGVQVTAYDSMSLLDVPLTVLLQDATAYEIAAAGCAACGAELGTTEAEFSAMPNGDLPLFMDTENDVQTWRDVFSWLSQAVGAFVTAGRDGKIYFRQYGREVVDQIDNFHRFTGCSFADYETQYTSISITSTADKITRKYSLPQDTGLTYDLGANPFLQMEETGVIEQRARAILGALQAVRYVPFEASGFADPAYDLGDVVRFSNGIADVNKLSCITLFDFNFQSVYRMAGVGDNPALSGAMSKTDKAVAGMSRSSSAAYRILSARSTRDATIPDQAANPTRVLWVRYSTSTSSLILIQAEIRIDITTTETGSAATGWTCNDAVCRVTYESDGVTLTAHHPVETWQDGAHILSLSQELLVSQDYQHDFKIFLEIGGGAGFVAAGDAAIYISGMGVDVEVDDPPTPPESRYLKYIAVTTPPTKTQYQVGEALNYAGAVVTAYYSDDTSAAVTSSCTFSPAAGTDTTELGPLQVTVRYTEGGITHVAYFDVSVVAVTEASLEQIFMGTLGANGATTIPRV